NCCFAFDFEVRTRPRRLRGPLEKDLYKRRASGRTRNSAKAETPAQVCICTNRVLPFQSVLPRRSGLFLHQHSTAIPTDRYAGVLLVGGCKMRVPSLPLS